MPEPEHFQSWSWYDAFRSCIITLSSWQLSPSESRTCKVSTAEKYSEKSFFPTIYRAECQKRKLSRSFRTQRGQHCTQGHKIKIIKRIKFNNQSTKFEFLWKEKISFIYLKLFSKYSTTIDLIWTYFIAWSFCKRISHKFWKLRTPSPAQHYNNPIKWTKWKGHKINILNFHCTCHSIDILY